VDDLILWFHLLYISQHITTQGEICLPTVETCDSLFFVYCMAIAQFSTFFLPSNFTSIV
jgi:hypothetical protein